MTHMEEILHGKTIVGIKVKSPSVWLQCSDGTWIELRAEGDCCSEAFVDATSFYASPTLTGKRDTCTFMSFATTQESDQVYVERFECTGGELAIMHRNSSNGYYGNYLSIRNRGTPPADAVDGNDWHREIER